MTGRTTRRNAGVVHGPAGKAAGCGQTGVAGIARRRGWNMAAGFGHYRGATGNTHVAQAGIMAGRAGCAGHSRVGRCCRCRGAAQNESGITVAGAAVQCADRNVVCDHVLATASPDSSRCAAAMTDQAGCSL